jgi:hypothetical protein
MLAHAVECWSMSEHPPCKPQPTLIGFYAWAFEEFLKAEDKRAGTLATQIMEEWFRQNGKMLRESYDITRERYQSETGAGAKVARLDAHRRQRRTNQKSGGANPLGVEGQ